MHGHMCGKSAMAQLSRKLHNPEKGKEAQSVLGEGKTCNRKLPPHHPVCPP